MSRGHSECSAFLAAVARSLLAESQLKWVSCETYLVCPFGNELCNCTLLITERQPARASLCRSSPSTQQGPSCLRCCYSVLGGGAGLGTELPGGSTCADIKSVSWAVFPAELASGRRETAAAAHLTAEAAQPDLRHQSCWPRSPRAGSWFPESEWLQGSAGACGPLCSVPGCLASRCHSCPLCGT